MHPLNIVKDSCKDIELNVFSPCYTLLPGKVYLAWVTPYDNMEYEVYKNDVLIASTEDKESEIRHPSEFEPGWWTNLFRRKTRHIFTYIDLNVRKYEHHTYKVKGIKKDSTGNILDTRESIDIRIEVN